MYYIINLTVPAAVYVLLAFFGVFGESHSIIKNILIYYTMLSIPHWVWAGISSYFEESNAAAIGGFSGLNTLLVVVGVFDIFQEKTPESAGIWLLYYFASPILIAFGACIGSALNSKRKGVV